MTAGPSWQRSSSLPSRVVLIGTTMIYAITYLYNPFWKAVLWSLLAFFVCSFSRVHLGYNYPSDCVMTLPIAILTTGFAHLMIIMYSLLSCCQIDSFLKVPEACYCQKEKAVTLYNYLSTTLNPT